MACIIPSGTPPTATIADGMASFSWASNVSYVTGQTLINLPTDKTFWNVSAGGENPAAVALSVQVEKLANGDVRITFLCETVTSGNNIPDQVEALLNLGTAPLPSGGDATFNPNTSQLFVPVGGTLNLTRTDDTVSDPSQNFVTWAGTFTFADPTNVYDFSNNYDIAVDAILHEPGGARKDDPMGIAQVPSDKSPNNTAVAPSSCLFGEGVTPTLTNAPANGICWTVGETMNFNVTSGQIDSIVPTAPLTGTPSGLGTQNASFLITGAPAGTTQSLTVNNS